MKLNVRYRYESEIKKLKRLLNPQGGYHKIDAYLLNPVSHDFWRQIVTLFSSCKSYK